MGDRMKLEEDYLEERLPLSGSQLTTLLLAGAGLEIELTELQRVTRQLMRQAAGQQDFNSSGSWDGCQWIEGRPSWKDDCKCGRSPFAGTAWCSEHFARVYGDPGSGIGAAWPVL
jgi:hypothetical protein